jgi:hypothetical protein
MSIKHMKWVVIVILAVAVIFIAVDFIRTPNKRYETLDEAVREVGSYNIADYFFSKLVLGKDPEVILYAVMGRFAIASNNRMYHKDDRGWHELNIREEASVRFQDMSDPTILSVVRHYRYEDQYLVVVSHWNALDSAELTDSLGSEFRKLEYSKVYAPDRVYTEFLLVTEELPDEYELILNGERHIKLDKVE